MNKDEINKAFDKEYIDYRAALSRDYTFHLPERSDWSCYLFGNRPGGVVQGLLVGERERSMIEPKVMHLKDWGATAMLNHAIDRIPNDETCIVLFYEDGELKTLSSHVDHQHAVWMYELAKLQTLHKCIEHEWEEA